MKKADWSKLIESLPQAMTQCEAARKIGKHPATVRYWLIKLHYPFADGRCVGWERQQRKTRPKFDPDKADWSLSYAELGRQFGVSRQYVHQVARKKHIVKP